MVPVVGVERPCHVVTDGRKQKPHTWEAALLGTGLRAHGHGVPVTLVGGEVYED